MTTWLARVLMFAAAGCAAVALYSGIRTPSGPELPLDVRATEQDLGTVSVGVREVTFPIYNPGPSPRRVINIAER